MKISTNELKKLTAEEVVKIIKKKRLIVQVKGVDAVECVKFSAHGLSTITHYEFQRKSKKHMQYFGSYTIIDDKYEPIFNVIPVVKK